MKELPQFVDAGCEIRVKGLGFSVQRPKGSADDPTVGDGIMAFGKCIMCLPLIKRLTKGKVRFYGLWWRISALAQWGSGRDDARSGCVSCGSCGVTKIRKHACLWAGEDPSRRIRHL